ncbi:uncharacterized protein ARMOST_13083 [Armillaria ostoyae]|uniref:PH domain-containing protein n=1 Tax=Armillaria ostoyae TaxID=47428 RepID=A0A284RLQ7_ARMOS|nr:uncharacterized protein ARMOST_13083 [Armillaria ostoyae]
MSTQLAPSTSTTTTPRWDSRNTGFVSPTRLQELRANTPRHHFTSSPQQQSLQSLQPTSPLSAPPMDAAQRPQLQGHGRASSFFASFRKQQQHPDAQQNGPQVQRNPSLLSRTNSNNPIGPPPPPHNPDTAASGAQRPAISRSPTQANPNWLSEHPEIRSVVGLTIAHAHKIYFSGPLIRKIERGADGQRPTKDEGWVEVWAQLGGTTLSVWDMKQIKEASQQGKEVPPAYVNTTDAFVTVLGSITVPATPSQAAQRYTNVLTLNTAGSNLLLFSCPSPESLISWAAALRLSAWEKSRLEEIYTAHLIRIFLKAPDMPSMLNRGRMEGWARIRISGQTDWKRVWMVVSAATEGERTSNDGSGPGSPPTLGVAARKKRMSNLFAREASPQRSGPSKASFTMFASQKVKDKKKALLTMTDITQAFAVYPERPELISRSTLIKVEGHIGIEDTAAGMRNREGWVLVMPELEPEMSQATEMLKWVEAFHDAFALYGRPQSWVWDPRSPTSLMFAYPVGPQKDLLFLDRELAETLDPRDDGTSVIRSRLLSILHDRMRGMEPPAPQNHGQTSLPSGGPGTGPQQSRTFLSGPQLPPLSFDNTQSQPQERHLLTPITEQSSIYTHGRSMSVDGQSILGRRQSVNVNTAPQSPVPEEFGGQASTFQSLEATPHSPTSVPKSPAKPLVSLPEKDVTTDELSNQEPNRSSYEIQQVPKRISLEAPLPRAPTSPRVQSPVSSKPHPSSHPVPSPTTSPAPGLQENTRSYSPSSVLTSPYSVATHSALGASVMASPSALTSPYSLEGAPVSPSSPTAVRRPLHSSHLPPIPQGTPPGAAEDSIGGEAGALYFMQYDNKGPSPAASPRLVSPPAENEKDEDSSSIESELKPTSATSRVSVTSSPATSTRSPLRTGTPKAFADQPASPPRDRMSPISRQALGRKPSGARAQTKKAQRVSSPSPPPVLEEDTQSDDSMEPEIRGRPSAADLGPVDEGSLDALAALSYLDDDQPPPPSPTTKGHVEPLHPRHIEQPLPPPPPPPVPAEPGAPYKSSFAPSKSAAERKAKVQAQQAAQQAAAHRPGRANGRKKPKGNDAWIESSEEDEDEEEEEEEEEEDVDSDEEPATRPPSAPASTSTHTAKPQSDYGPDQSQYAHLRPPRMLPQVPGSRPKSAEPEEFPQRRNGPEQQHPEAARRTQYDEGTQIRSQADYPQLGAARQSMWSQVLDPGRPAVLAQERDTFVQLESPSHTMTKAFTPQGLLSAGLQDKQDRSAKRQEELARENGASLINVPNKPPPPQTGLLGAITAHERERKREGGVGAALTEREREKRMVEERQRKFDEQQRQQIEMGSMYGGQFNGFNPMMNPMMMGMMGMNPMMTGQGMNPMMTGPGLNPMMTGQGLNPMMTGQAMNPMMTGQGMNPMMTGQGMNPMMSGFPGMMPGYNPQQMFAAQQAAQAYQQAMMAFSVAGSQAGGDGGAGVPQQPLNPMMTGGFDPRMSMMSMPMMGGQVPSLGMQMTGMSSFDPRFTPNNGLQDPSLQPPNALSGSPKQYASNASSPVGRGSPLARTVDPPLTLDIPRNSSRPTSPKP